MTYSKKYLAKIILSNVDHTSCDPEKSKEYLKENKIDPDNIYKEGIKRIKKLQLQAAAAKKRAEMESTKSIKQKAIDWVDSLINDVNFSFPSFVKSNNLVLHNRNIDSFNQEDIKNSLTQYFYLKFVDPDNTEQDEQQV
ncbi:hypothetical protein [Hymenobacter edaphi]|uniref:hypothetical protein n=1 Tax=Hymenobacter edaphi TaxID=2211146 RepID=UPI0010582493|nr:hypothetical protein [Hymenobacter edaphi]